MTTGLFDALLDDAAVFPPGNAPLPAAVAAHLTRQQTPEGRYVGALVLPLAALPELDAELGPEDALRVALTVPPGELAEALPAALPPGPRVTLAAVETRLTDDPATTAAQLDAAVPAGVTTWVEVPVGAVDPATCAALAGAGHGLKLRTGGENAAAFPSVPTLAAALTTAVRAGVPVKLTAGLHHAVRHHDPGLDVAQHGFLNVVLAVAATLAGEQDRSEQWLGVTDPAEVTRAVGRLTPEERTAVRRELRSLGTCSVAEPLQDLAALGLLEETA